MFVRGGFGEIAALSALEMVESIRVTTGSHGWLNVHLAEGLGNLIHITLKTSAA